jgi:hypothetical protein
MLEALADGRWTPVGQGVLAKNSPIEAASAAISG